VERRDPTVADMKSNSSLPGNGRADGAALRMGRVSAWAVVALAVAYVATGAVWAATRGNATLTPSDPFLAILETLLLLSTPFLLLVSVAVHGSAPASARASSRAALAFMLLAVAITSTIHFAQLTVLRRLDPAARAALAPIAAIPWRWPSLAYALDLFAWDACFGLALLFSAPVFPGAGLEAAIRRTLRLAGGLCVAGTLGPALGDLRFQYLGIAGYAGVFPVACALLARWFGRAGHRDRVSD
jgi:hypothetical protein